MSSRVHGDQFADQVAQIEHLVGEAMRTIPEPLRGASEELVIVVDGTRPTGLYGLFDGAPRGAPSKSP